MSTLEAGLSEVNMALVVRREALVAITEAERQLGSFSVTQLPLGTPREARESAEVINVVHLNCLSTPNSGQIGDLGLLGRRLHIARFNLAALVVESKNQSDLASFWEVSEREFGAPIIATEEDYRH